MSERTEKAEEQSHAEDEVESFRRNLGPFVVAAETTRMPMVFTDARQADNAIIFANDSFLALTGYAREEVLGRSFDFLMSIGADPDAAQRIQTAFDGTSDATPLIHYRRKDGSEFWATVFITPVRDADGAIVQHFTSFTDLTEQIQQQARSRMLIDELNHRVKNTLSTVQSIVRQAFRRSPDLESVRDSIETRIFALSRSHDLLSRESWKGAPLRDVVREALQPFEVGPAGTERFTVEGEPCRLSPRATLTLGIAFNELATNAVKYGALANDIGSIAISWDRTRVAEGDRLVLRWRETGGPAVAPPTREGFGSKVIGRGLAYELGGVVERDFQPGGLICTIDLPATHIVLDG